MKFKEIKPIIRAEFLIIFESFPSYNVLRKENWQLWNPDEPTEWDDYQVGMISGKADCELYVYIHNPDSSIEDVDMMDNPTYKEWKFSNIKDIGEINE